MIVQGGTDIGVRIDGLAAALGAAGDRLPADLTAEAHDIVDRAAGRLKLSADHTVVAIAGATGSGKSSTFNALTGLELAAVGVRRPTTSWATACVWGAHGARELLEWLGIPERHQTTRDSMLDTRRESNDFDGMVLLDLPDHDSTEVAHHLEVDRLVVLADLLVWVLDPQKYADAAIHDRYLQPLRTHADVTVVVLNHIDEVPEDRREGMLADVRRLLEADGLPDVPVIGMSAKLGWGVDELRAEIAGRVADKRATRSRIEADVRSVATRLEEASGDAKARQLADTRVEALEDALADAAGVPTRVAAAERSARIRGRRATGWPVVSWVSALRPDPLTRLDLDLGAAAPIVTGAGADTGPVTAQRSRVDTEVRALADDAAAGLGEPWQASIRQASVSRIDELNTSLNAAVAGTDLGVSKLPVWVTLVRVLQWLLILAVLGGLAWGVVTGLTGRLDEVPSVGGLALPWVLAAAGAGLGILVALISLPLVSAAARSRAAGAEERLQLAVSEVAATSVVEPIEAELAAYAEVRAGLARALA